MRSSNLIAITIAFAVAACGDPRNDPKPEPRTPGSNPVIATATASSTVASSAPTSSAKPSSRGDEAAKLLDAAKKLNDREKTELVAQLDKLSAPCADTPVTLAECIVDKRSCATCKPAAELVARLVRGGVPSAELGEFYKMRFDPANVKTIDIGNAPSKGPDDAIVTIVEWADFQCPACREVRPAFELAMERFPGQVRVVYKYYRLTIPGHERALDAALAAEAAHQQGKFWEMHKKLFDNGEHLERADLRKYAREIGLDLDKFKKDMDSEETKKTVEASIKQADELGLEGTPMIFVNGRRFELNPFSKEFEHWIALDIEQAGQKPAEPTEKYNEIRKAIGLDKLDEMEGGAGPLDSAAPATSASAEPPGSASASAGPATSAAAGSAKPAAGSAKPAAGSAKPPKPTPAPTATAPAPAPNP
ncbi:MAG: thioredoxin domain-containing protein [Polyangiaceae bacterium]|nr:thioredoxin domain-containing protein [Polyangiaceae bacterium]